MWPLSGAIKQYSIKWYKCNEYMHLHTSLHYMFFLDFFIIVEFYLYMMFLDFYCI